MKPRFKVSVIVTAKTGPGIMAPESPKINEYKMLLNISIIRMYLIFRITQDAVFFLIYHMRQLKDVNGNMNQAAGATPN